MYENTKKEFWNGRIGDVALIQFYNWRRTKECQQNQLAGWVGWLVGWLCFAGCGLMYTSKKMSDPLGGLGETPEIAGRYENSENSVI